MDVILLTDQGSTIFTQINKSQNGLKISEQEREVSRPLMAGVLPRYLGQLS